jgi:hypothetical protein
MTHTEAPNPARILRFIPIPFEPHGGGEASEADLPEIRKTVLQKTELLVDWMFDTDEALGLPQLTEF